MSPSIVCMFLFVNISPGSVIRAGSITVSVTRLSVIRIILEGGSYAFSASLLDHCKLKHKRGNKCY